MIIGVIGDYCSGKKTFIELIKMRDPNVNVVISERSDLQEKKKRDSIEHKLDQFIDKEQSWLDNHRKITNLLSEEKEKNQLNEKKSKESTNIKDKVRNQIETIIILNLTFEDYKLLMNKSSFRLIKIDSPAKKRFLNYQARNQIISPNLEDYENFLANDEKFFLENQHNLFKSTISYTIVNKGDFDSFKINTHDFWDAVLKKFRPTWDDYFINVALHVADRASCVKTKVGAVIVKEKRIVSTGFNGTPHNVPNCQDGYCPRCHKNIKQGEGMESCFCIHAEENSIIEVGREKCNGGTIYVTFSPCLHCAKLIIQSGIKKVVYLNEYNAEFSFTLLKAAGVEIEKYIEDKHIYDK